jgi:hypothetical protein
LNDQGLMAKPAFNRHLRLASLLTLLGSVAVSPAQREPEQRPPPLDPVQARREARDLVMDLLAQRPAHSSTNTGQIRIRDRDGQEREIPARFEVVCTVSNWLSVYETLRPGGKPTGARLVVAHADNRPNQYWLTEGGAPGATNASPKQLVPNQTMIAFAGCDFWVADLGLEFLYWPEQRLLRKEMRHSKSCGVLESKNPEPSPGGYSRVVSWVTLDSPHGLVHADAYDSRGELLKLFDPVNLEKVQGNYQLVEMEMRNRQTDSHTWIKFDLPRE